MSSAMTRPLMVPVLRDSDRASVVVVTSQEHAEKAYERLQEHVVRRGNWLCSNPARLLPEGEWQRHFADYEQDLERLRVLGDALRPKAQRDPYEPRVSDPELDEWMALFAS